MNFMSFILKSQNELLLGKFYINRKFDFSNIKIIYFIFFSLRFLLSKILNIILNKKEN